MVGFLIAIAVLAVLLVTTYILLVVLLLLLLFLLLFSSGWRLTIQCSGVLTTLSSTGMYVCMCVCVIGEQVRHNQGLQL